MNRGSIGRREALSPDQWSFNEAPIHESGKSSGHDHGARRDRCFNEAPIHESGKYPPLNVLRHPGHVLQ